MSDATNPLEIDDATLGDDDASTEVETDQSTTADDQSNDAATEGDDEGSPSGEDAEEYEEVERGDKRYKIPKALKDEFLMASDYTRKSQVLAEENRRFEERVKGFEAASEEHLAAAVEVKLIKEELDAVSTLTDDQWAHYRALDQQDGGDRVNRLMRALTTLPQKLAEAEGKSNAKRDEVLKAQSEMRTKQLEEGQAILARDIPGWGPELGAKLTNFVGAKYGVTADKHGASFEDPALVKMANDAYKWNEHQRKAATAQKAQTATQNPPPRTANRAAPATGLSGNLSTDEWIRRRNEQAAKRR